MVCLPGKDPDAPDDGAVRHVQVHHKVGARADARDGDAFRVDVERGQGWRRGVVHAVGEEQLRHVGPSAAAAAQKAPPARADRAAVGMWVPG